MGDIVYVEGRDYRVLESQSGGIKFSHQFFPKDRKQRRHDVNKGQVFRARNKVFEIGWDIFESAPVFEPVSPAELVERVLPKLIGQRLETMLQQRT